MAVIEYFTFGVVDDNIIVSLGEKSVLSCVLYLAVLCVLIGNDRRIAGDIEGFRADLNPDALLTISARNRLYTLKPSGAMVLPVVSETVGFSDNGERVLDRFPLRRVGDVSSNSRGSELRARVGLTIGAALPAKEGVAELDRISCGRRSRSTL